MTEKTMYFPDVGTNGTVAIVNTDPPPVNGVVMMDENEALVFEQRIIKTANVLGSMLIAFKDREGWKALGYESWTAYVNSGRLDASRATLYRAMKDFRLSQIETFHGLNPSQKRALDQFPEQYQASVRTFVESELQRLNTPMTALAIEEHGESFMQAMFTGHVDDADGNPMHIAGDAIASEREKRHNQHKIDGIRNQPGAFEVIIVPGQPAETASAIADRLTMAELDALTRAIVDIRWQRIRDGERVQ